MREITARCASEIVAHEGIVQEAYRDSVGVWTWSAGITDASGHRVMRYKDTPQPLDKCIAVYLWLLRTKFLPDVLKAFGDREPTEAQLTAALSFHWNTGAIGRATWIKSFVAGRVADAETQIMNWTRPASLTERRKRERDLFFDDVWTGDGTALVYDVAKPAYRPVRPHRVPVDDAIAAALRESGQPS